jgi:hypothetical protein
MLSNFAQFAPQGLAPQIPGLQGTGVPQLNSGPGQAGIYGNPWSGHEQGQQVPPWAGQINPFGHNPLAQGQGTAYTQLHGSVQIVPVLAQLAQQLTIQCAITQQIAQQVSVAIQQLANQLSAQGLQGQYYGQNPYAVSMQQGGYPGFNPQAQAWGPNRQQTIQ